MPRRTWPEWWGWDLELSPHVCKRMVDRSFTELDLRAMLWSSLRTQREPMSEAYLEVTYRHGEPLAAYYHLPRRPGDRASRSTRGPAGLLVDYTRSGRAIGIEITAPSLVSLAAMNRLLRDLGQRPVRREEIAPLLAA